MLVHPPPEAATRAQHPTIDYNTDNNTDRAVAFVEPLAGTNSRFVKWCCNSGISSNVAKKTPLKQKNIEHEFLRESTCSSEDSEAISILNSWLRILM